MTTVLTNAAVQRINAIKNVCTVLASELEVFINTVYLLHIGSLLVNY